MKTRKRVTALGLVAMGAALIAPSVLAQSTPTGPLSLPPQAQAELDKQLTATYDFLRPELEGLLDKEVTKLANSTHGKLTIGNLALTKKDLTAAPRIEVTPLVTGAHSFLFFHWGTPKYDGEQVQIEIPKNGSSWSAQVQGHFDFDVKVLFTIHLSEDVTLNLDNLQASETIQLDTSDPTLPVCKKTGDLNVNYDLDVSTGHWWMNALLFLFHPVIDIVVHNEVDHVLKKLDTEIATIQGLPNPNAVWGTGAPPRAAFGSQPDLEKFALQCSSDVQAVHMPYNTILTAEMSDPTYGQGTPTAYAGHGDSAIWTGHYLAGEAFRYKVTQDPAALANAQRAIAGITDLFDAESPGDGHLSRCIVPLTDPQAQTLLADPSAFQTTLHGQPYVALDHISRDQYLGVMHGLGCAYDFIDDPATKSSAAQLIQRCVDYLVANSWNALEHDNVTLSAPFVQSPIKMVAFSLLAAETDPKYAPLADELGDLSYIEWVTTWPGSLDPLSSYYGWNLGYGATYHAMRLETDPNRFAALQRAEAIVLRTVGHHENAYFQTIDCALDPTLATTLAPEITDELRRFTAYGRRARTVTNSTDPSIEQAQYTVPLHFQKTGPNNTPGVTPLTETMAKYPVPVDQRVSTDFLWQRNPFELDGTGDPREQPPGVDAILPYWMARYYQLVP